MKWTCSRLYANAGHYKEQFECSFHSRKYWSRVTWIDCNRKKYIQDTWETIVIFSLVIIRVGKIAVEFWSPTLSLFPHYWSSIRTIRWRYGALKLLASLVHPHSITSNGMSPFSMQLHWGPQFSMILGLNQEAEYYRLPLSLLLLDLAQLIIAALHP